VGAGESAHAAQGSLMKAVALEAYGGPGQLRLMDLPVPVPGDDEVLIELAYTSVNPVDWKIREGQLKDRMPNMFPIIPGWDAAGTVKEVGRNVTRFKGGERVFAYCRKPTVQWGTYAEYVTMDARHVALMPKNLSFAGAAAIPLVGLTAWQSVFDSACLDRGQSVLIHAGAGGVGGMAIQFARHVGAKVYATASRRNHDYVRALGAAHVIDYTTENFVDAISRLEPDGVDVVLDTVGAEVYRASFAALKRGGYIVSIRQHPDEQLNAQHGVRSGYVFVRPDGEQLGAIAYLIEEGVVRPPEIEEMRLEDAAAAQEKSRAGHVRGKIVLRIR
jgi:NADPH2:quinone reductase